MREIINRQVAQLTRLIDELLDVTRIARNKIALQKGQVELGQLLRRTAEDYQALFQERCLQLEVSCSPTALHMEADAARLAQVVGNLLHNAAKFTPVGGGARVMVAKDEAGQSALISIKDSGLGCSRRILVIEDIVDVAYMLKSLLEKEGHQVMVAHSGNHGITLARSFRPEVLLCDIGLPGMDGYEVARIFSADEELKHVHLVSLTGYARPEDLRRAKKAGFHCQLAKPVDLAILKQALAKLSR